MQASLRADFEAADVNWQCGDSFTRARRTNLDLPIAAGRERR